MTRKPFDCVEMKRQAAETIYEHIKNMTIEEELDFWNTPMASDSATLAPSDNDKTPLLDTPVKRRSPKRQKKQPDRCVPVA